MEAMIGDTMIEDMKKGTREVVTTVIAVVIGLAVAAGALLATAAVPDRARAATVDSTKIL